MRWDEDAPLIREILDLIGDKWSVLVIASLEAGPLRYSDLHQAIPGVSQRMLTLKLRYLQRDGLVARTAYAEVPPRVEYRLTGLGTTLLGAVTGLHEWAAAHRDEVRASRVVFDDDRTA